eukprot:gene1738-1935_t
MAIHNVNALRSLIFWQEIQLVFICVIRNGRKMDGNDNSRESPSQQNQMDCERIATLLRNAIQLVGLNSGSNWGSLNTSDQSQPTGLGQLQLDRAPRPTSPSHMSINGMPSRRIPSGETMLGNPVNPIERRILALPVRFGGLGIHDPTKTAAFEYNASRKITEGLKELIVSQNTSIETMDHTKVKKTKQELKIAKENQYKEELKYLIANISPLKQRCLEASREKSASSWLTVLPLRHLGYTFNKQQFRDAICLRYNFDIQGIPKYCACGIKNDITHALTCKKGGYVTMRHNALRDCLANTLKEVCADVRVEPQLLPVNPNDYQSRTNTSEGARLDISAIGVQGSFERTYFDVRVSNPNAPSNVTLTLNEVYRKNEKEKKDMYEERVINSEKGSFAPLVFLTTGGMGPECATIVKRVAEMIANKRDERYADKKKKKIPNPKGRRKRAASTRFPAPYFVPPTTWTHEFFLLSKSSAHHTPERSQIDTMQKAGLGRCKVVFEDKRGNHAHVRATLEQYYPKLALQNGTFQLLRCLSGGCGTRELSVIPMGVDGYPISLLKEVCKSSTIYIRPMQTSLSMESVLPDVPQTVYQGNIAMAQCQNCNSEVELSKFNDHTANCPKMNASIDDCVLPSEVKGYDHKVVNSNSISHTLQTIFVDKEIEELQRAATQSSDVHTAVDVILDAQRGDLPTSSVVDQPTGPASYNDVETATISSLQQLLVQFQEEYHSTQEVKISVDRDEVWRCGLLFYKKGIANPGRLHMNVEVNFTGLTGEQ